MSGEAFVYHAVRGYWIAGLIEDECPGVLKYQFLQNWQTDSIEPEIAIEMGMKPENFWAEIDTAVIDHFGETMA